MYGMLIMLGFAVIMAGTMTVQHNAILGVVAILLGLFMVFINALKVIKINLKSKSKEK